MVLRTGNFKLRKESQACPFQPLLSQTFLAGLKMASAAHRILLENTRCSLTLSLSLGCEFWQAERIQRPGIGTGAASRIHLFLRVGGRVRVFIPQDYANTFLTRHFCYAVWLKCVAAFSVLLSLYFETHNNLKLDALECIAITAAAERVLRDLQSCKSSLASPRTS